MAVSKIMDRNQTRKALKLYYANNAENRAYALAQLEGTIDHNIIGIENLSVNSDGGYFCFEYIGRKRFKCSTTFPELLEVR
jgi:hypothetical protein